MTMETILKELKGSNRSGGNTLNFTRIRIKGFFTTYEEDFNYNDVGDA